MKKYRELVKCGVVILMLGAWGSAAPQIAEVTRATKMVAPSVPKLAALLHVGGSVTVEVAIRSSGEVESARVIDGHVLLRSSVLKATERWRFEPSSNSHHMTLTFVFPDRLLGEAAVVKVRPYDVDLVAEPTPPPDTVSWLPEGFQEGITRCRVHGTLLRKDKVEISYGLTAYKVGYLKAEQKYFPNSAKVALGGCIVESTKYAEVAYCARCRKAHSKWSLAHRNEKRYSYTGS